MPGHDVEATPILRLDEETVYGYFCWVDSQRLAASRASSLLESWGFAVGVFGFVDVHQVLASLRCKGAAHRLALSKKPTNPRDALQMDFVIVLEFAAVFTRDPLLRAIAGYCMLFLNGRLRCNDGARIAYMEDEGLFLKASCSGRRRAKAGTSGPRSSHS